MPGESYRRQLMSLLLYLCYVFRRMDVKKKAYIFIIYYPRKYRFLSGLISFRAVINSFVCWFSPAKVPRMNLETEHPCVFLSWCFSSKETVWLIWDGGKNGIWNDWEPSPPPCSHNSWALTTVSSSGVHTHTHTHTQSWKITYAP